MPPTDPFNVNVPAAAAAEPVPANATAEPAPVYAGYASGSDVLDETTWTAAVAKLLATFTSREEKGRDGKVTVLTDHETDPPEHGRWTRRVPRPGPLPVLVLESEIGKGAKTREHTTTVVLGHTLDLDCYHNARFAVCEARRQNAKGLALRAPKPVEDGCVELAWVMVL